MEDKTFLLVALFGMLSMAEPAAQAPQPSPACNNALWQNVYHPDRLPTKDDCRTLGGTIKNFKAEPDGDYHIRFQTDDPTSRSENHFPQASSDCGHAESVA